MKTLRTSLLLLVSLGAITLSGLQADPVPGDQPRMRDALARLQDARPALRRAAHNKAGHRDTAPELVHPATAQVHPGLPPVHGASS